MYADYGKLKELTAEEKALVYQGYESARDGVKVNWKAIAPHLRCWVKAGIKDFKEGR